MEKDYFESLNLKKVSSEDIESIKKYKAMYSIIKYQKQSEAFQEENKDKYMNVLLINNDNISEDMLPEVVEKLDELKEKVNKVRSENQNMIDNLVEVVIMNLAHAFEEMDNNIISCVRIFQYVTKSIKYSKDLLNYEYNIPFASDYQFECYNGIPNGKEYEDILITKEGTSFEIATLMTFLGRVFGVNIKTIPAICNGKTYYINSYTDGNITSYLDPTSAIIKKDDSKYCLITKTQLATNCIVLDSNKEDYEEGVDIKFDIKHASNIDKAISRERNVLSEKAAYIKENVLNEENKKI